MEIYKMSDGNKKNALHWYNENLAAELFFVNGILEKAREYAAIKDDCGVTKENIRFLRRWYREEHDENC